MRSRLDPVEKKLAKFLEDWLIMQQEMYGSQRMWGIEGDTKAADIFAWLLENGRCLDRDLENTEKLNKVILKNYIMVLQDLNMVISLNLMKSFLIVGRSNKSSLV